VRPIKLEIQGLTSYRQPISVDFTELDLFAVTGPTGSGKSSLIDAITYALYGKVPRVGNNIKELISHGADRLKVTLYFNVGDGQYRIYRESAHKGGKPPQIERFDQETGEWRPEDVGRVRDVNKFIEDLLLLDYEAFIRSVLLPQGEFQEFLAGDRDERRKVLDRLLQIGVYTVMAQRANTLATESARQADTMKERLDTELADATAEALAAAAANLQDIEKSAADMAAKRAQLELACTAADRLASARDRERRERSEAERIARNLKEAQALLTGGEQALSALDDQLADARQKLTGTGYDPDVRLKLTQARDHAQERDRIAGRLDNITTELQKVREGTSTLQADATTARKRCEEALAAVAALTAVHEGVRRSNVAVDLRTGIKAGDICPVCGERITSLPEGTHNDLSRAADDLRAAQNQLASAEEARKDTEQRGARFEEQIAALGNQFGELQVDLERRHTALEEVLGDRSVTTASLAAQLNAAEAGRKQAAELEQQVQSLAEQREKQAQAMSSAQQEAATLGATVQARERNAENAATEAAEDEVAVRSIASAQHWTHVMTALEQGHGAAALLRQDLDRVKQDESGVNQSIGATRTRIEQIQANITLAEELRTKEKEHREQAMLARDLASVLKTTNFPAFIRDSAMQALAAGGSAWLKKVSGGRYDLKVHEQDFQVADLWNAGDERPVRTLSGGETFLASLSLALALADYLPGAAGDGDSSTLQSLFIDEGFSHLDEETLNIVAGALEVLGQDRRRLIGVVTHVPALAERMPARIVVHKTQAGSTVTVE
jgi:exonuclease SbcC